MNMKATVQHRRQLYANACKMASWAASISLDSRAWLDAALEARANLRGELASRLAIRQYNP